jgi:hypothetical protein
MMAIVTTTSLSFPDIRRNFGGVAKGKLDWTPTSQLVFGVEILGSHNLAKADCGFIHRGNVGTAS